MLLRLFCILRTDSNKGHSKGVARILCGYMQYLLGDGLLYINDYTNKMVQLGVLAYT